MSGKRDPFPFLKYENDHTFTGDKERQKLSYRKPTHIAHNEQPWSRLNDTATVASSRRNISYHDPEVPKNSLDLHLQSTYDQNRDFLKNKNETLYQKETLGHESAKNLEEEASQDKIIGLPRVWVHPERPSIHSIKGNIASHHSPSTIMGYCRKPDGGFYCT